MAPPNLQQSSAKLTKQTLTQALRMSERKHRAEIGPGPLVIAVSGGADSLALLFTAVMVQPQFKRDLIVAHFSHGIRKSAERGEANLVKRVAKQLKLPVVHERSDIEPSEAAARTARYAFLARASHSVKAAAVLTAHTQDDQAETLLLRVTRGSGLRGAGAIRELTSRVVGGYKLTLLRPLLSIGREDTIATCREQGIIPASDGSNRLLKYARNRMRHHVMRELKEINPMAREALARFATAAQDDDDLLRTLADDSIEGIEEKSAGSVAWPVSRLRQLPDPLLIRIFQRGWASITGQSTALSQQQMSAVLSLVRGGEGGVLNLGNQSRLVVEQRSVKLTRHTSAPKLLPSQLTVPGATTVGDWVIEATIEGDGVWDRNPWHATIDLEKLGDNVVVRSRETGDRVELTGMKNSVSLQNLLVNAKVPRGDRDSLPLIVGNRGIAWIAGLRIADWARVTDTTRHFCEIRVRRRENH